MRASSPLLVVVLVLALARPATAQQVHVVDSTGAGGAFLEIQDAVDAALDFDLVLVEDGSYAGVTIDGKAVRIVADSLAAPVVASLYVRNLSASQSVELHGLRVQGGGTLVFVEDCAGPVLLQDSVLTVSGIGIGSGVRVDGSAAFTMVRSSIDATAAFSVFIDSYGVSATDSGVFVHDSQVAAGDGFPGDAVSGTPGQSGPAAFRLRGGTAVVVGSTLVGGEGGRGTLNQTFGVCSDAGDGGPAVQLVQGETAPLLELYDSTTTPGAGGLAVATSGCADGLPGMESEVLAGAVQEPAVFARGFDATTVVRFGEIKTTLFTGQPFDFVFHAFSVNPSALVGFVPGLHGAVYPGSPSFLRFRGFLDGAGEKTLQFAISDTGFPFVPLYEQAVLYNATEELVVSNPRFVALVDSATP